MKYCFYLNLIISTDSFFFLAYALKIHFYLPSLWWITSLDGVWAFHCWRGGPSDYRNSLLPLRGT